MLISRILQLRKTGNVDDMRVERIPVKEYEGIKEAIQGRDLSHLVYIHDRYELTNYRYCCGSPGKQGEVWDLFTFAIETEKLILE